MTDQQVPGLVPGSGQGLGPSPSVVGSVWDILRGVSLWTRLRWFLSAFRSAFSDRGRSDGLPIAELGHTPRAAVGEVGPGDWFPTPEHAAPEQAATEQAGMSAGIELQGWIEARAAEQSDGQRSGQARPEAGLGADVEFAADPYEESIPAAVWEAQERLNVALSDVADAQWHLQAAQAYGPAAEMSEAEARAWLDRATSDRAAAEVNLAVAASAGTAETVVMTGEQMREEWLATHDAGTELQDWIEAQAEEEAEQRSEAWLVQEQADFEAGTGPYALESTEPQPDDTSRDGAAVHASAQAAGTVAGAELGEAGLEVGL